MRKVLPTLRYWMEVEVHVFGFSIAANVLLSFFPFLLVLIWFCRSTGWTAAEQAVFFAMSDFFGPEVTKLIRQGVDWVPNRFRQFNYTSLLLLLFTANGIFEPLEVALNRCWGVTKNRSFLMNQLVSMGLIFACGSLVILSIVLGALNQEFLKLNSAPGLWIVSWVAPLILKTLALPVQMASLFLIYWILPNTKVDWRRVVPIAMVVGIILEAFKYFMKLIWPWFIWKVKLEYGPFYWAVVVVLLSFLASMIVLAGAEWASRPARNPVLLDADQPEPTV